jgi:hypothetical protein
MPRETPSPIDLPGPAILGGNGLRWTGTAIAVASLFLLLTNGVALQGWLYEQRPGPIQAWAAARADDWVALTDRIGLGAPRAGMHARWKRAEAARFGGGDQR